MRRFGARRPGHDGEAMIALLLGRVEGVEADRCIVDVNGVGYLVQASTRTLPPCPQRPPMRISRRADRDAGALRIAISLGG